jgi:enduracididine biosynthesis enzyme MppP
MAHATIDDRTAHSNLTRYEISALAAEVGISDGHPRQRPTAKQLEILRSMPELFEQAGAERFEDLERRAQSAFLSSTGQYAAPVSAGRVLSCYSSSVVMDVVARTLASSFIRVGLVHPTFDNIPDILKSWGLKLVPLEEEALMAGEITVAIDELDVVFVTTPNNPTGAYLGADALRSLAEQCAEAGVLLALDVCFRGFDRRFQYDSYALLDATGVQYVLIEDTGKLWPTSELKLGFVAFSANCPLALMDAMSDILLSVSPFVLALVSELAGEAAEGGYDELHNLIRANRLRLTDALQGTPARVVDRLSRVSVARIELPPEASARDTYRSLRAAGVHVLPCGPFHWAAQEEGERYIRVALGRDATLIETAARRLGSFFGQEREDG